MNSGQLTFPLVEAGKARNQGMTRVEDAADEWAKAVVDQAVLSLAALRPVSANDFRDQLPEIGNRALIGARIRSLAMRGLLVKVGEVTSTDVGTHCKSIAVWRAT